MQCPAWQAWPERQSQRTLSDQRGVNQNREEGQMNPANQQDADIGSRPEEGDRAAVPRTVATDPQSPIPDPQLLRVLFVDDNAMDTQLLARELKAGGFKVSWQRVDTADDMRSALDSGAWDLIACDYSMPGFGGLAALRVRRDAGVDTPIIMISGTVGEEVAVECMRQGAHDYLMKDNLTRLCEAARRELREAAMRRGRREADAKYQALFESSRDAIMTLAPPTWRYTAGNAAALEMLCIRDEQHLTATSFWELSPDMQQDGRPSEERAKKMIAMAMRKGSHFFEWQHRRLSGGDFPATVLLTRIDLGDQAFLQATVRDETNRLALEGQLRQSQKIEAIGQLAGGVAHDFNNMLGVILGHTEMAMEDVDPTQPLYADLQEILKAARRSADLTRQLLTFARKQVISPRPVDLNEALSGMLKMLRRVVGENIGIDWQPCEGLWPVMMDPSQIDQIFANLCVNARDAIGDVGAITITLANVTRDEADRSGQIQPAAGECVLLSLSDDGCGMDPETAARIFEPFFTTKTTGKGTGLGLATVYGIVRQNGGEIGVSSEPGRGTTFDIYLRRHAGAVPAVTDRAGTLALRGTETILLVEDELAILDLVTKMLENQGYTVLAANSPEDAIRLANDHADRIQLLLTDVVMPGMNGRDLATKLVAICPHLACLFMSGYTDDAIAQHGVLDEGVHFVHKPFSIRDLATKVREALECE